MDDAVRIQPIRQRRIFTLQEARDCLPVIRRVTESARQHYELVVLKLSEGELDSVTWVSLEEEAAALVGQWVESVARLGCEAQGLWTVDFDSGSGYYCWKLGEGDVGHFHGYEDGFRHRVRLPEGAV